VGNLSFAAAGEDLQHLLADDGLVRKCSLPLDRDTGRKRGFAFIELADANDETKAIPHLWAWTGWAGGSGSTRQNPAPPRRGAVGAGDLSTSTANLLRVNGRSTGAAFSCLNLGSHRQGKQEAAHADPITSCYNHSIQP
jgi:hypothetical protein